MIKVGDKLHHQGKEWNVEFAGKPFVHLKHGDDFIIESSHIFWNKLYVEQKQRADELEKRWSELREHVIARSDACKERRMIRERDALIDVMAAMHDLEENNNA